MLDRGEQLGWFGSPEIVAELIVSIAGFDLFLRALADHSTSRWCASRSSRDRNFLICCFFMVIMGADAVLELWLFSAPFIQNVLGYPIETTGWLLASRGLGTLVGIADDRLACCVCSRRAT